jgi:hypothetical protein
MDIIELLKTIKEDWALLVFVFGLGAAWFQGKMWFEKTNKILESVGAQHTVQNNSLDLIHSKIDRVDDRIGKVEQTVFAMHEELHEQEIKLAVLESNNTITIPPKRTRLRRQQ